jgi:hypothetical protein
MPTMQLNPLGLETPPHASTPRRRPGIKLTSVASEILGVSARLTLEAFVTGTQDPEVLADLARGRLRASYRPCVRRWTAISAPSTTG